MEEVKPVIDSKSPDWTEYVLSHLTENEMYKGNPKVNGLRRMVELFCGDIVGNEVVVIQPLTADCKTVSVKYGIKISTAHRTAYFESIADASANNVQGVYAKYLTTMAESRAEGRAYRKALKINIVTAEEIDEEIKEEVNRENMLTDGQINCLAQLASRIDVDVLAFLTADGKDIKTMTYEDGQNAIQKMAAFQRKVSDIPPALKGYRSDWRQ